MLLDQSRKSRVLEINADVDWVVSPASCPSNKGEEGVDEQVRTLKVVAVSVFYLDALMVQIEWLQEECALELYGSDNGEPPLLTDALHEKVLLDRKV